MSQAKKDDTVKVHYTGKLSDGNVFDSSKERDPLEFKVGAGQVIPGFEQAVEGMAVEETKEVTIPSTEAYGPVREELKQEVNKSNLPPELKPEVGMQLSAKNQEGGDMVVTVAEVKDESILIDANHPLAGKDLTFEIELVEIA